MSQNNQKRCEMGVHIVLQALLEDRTLPFNTRNHLLCIPSRWPRRLLERVSIFLAPPVAELVVKPIGSFGFV